MGFAYVFRSLDCVTPHFVSYLGGEEEEGGREREWGMGKREVILGAANRFLFCFLLF